MKELVAFILLCGLLIFIINWEEIQQDYLFSVKGTFPCNFYPIYLLQGTRVHVQISWDKNNWINYDVQLINPNISNKPLACACSKRANPDIFEHTVAVSGVYNLIVLQLEEDTAQYNLRVRLNSTQIIDYNGKAYAAYPRACSHEIEIQKGAVVQLKFDGSASQIFVFSPGSDTLIPTLRYENIQRNATFRTVFNMDVEGVWHILLYESGNDLNSYTLILTQVQCDQGFIMEKKTFKCFRDCSNTQQKLLNEFPECRCQEGYFWNEQLYKCMSHHKYNKRVEPKNLSHEDFPQTL